jgi:hypothetical protein
MAASSSYYDKFVLVWETATGTVLRQLESEEAGLIMPLEIAVLSTGD